MAEGKKDENKGNDGFIWSTTDPISPSTIDLPKIKPLVKLPIVTPKTPSSNGSTPK